MAQLEFADASRLSHAYILSAQSREEGIRTARRLAAAAVCTASGPVPCMKCRSCRKVAEGIHPDVISVARLVDDKGRQKKEITVDQVRRMAADSYVLPNEAARKVYIIEDADMMNVQAQNAALKLLEEPPAGVMFILCAENAQLLLPTVRSRCATAERHPGRNRTKTNAREEQYGQSGKHHAQARGLSPGRRPHGIAGTFRRRISGAVGERP